MNDSAIRLMVRERRETITATVARGNAHCGAIVEQLQLNTDSHDGIDGREIGRRIAVLALLAGAMMSGLAGDRPSPPSTISSRATAAASGSALTMEPDAALQRISAVGSAARDRNASQAASDAVKDQIRKEVNR